MKRLGPQTKKLFEVSKAENKGKTNSKKYTFILPIELMKKVKYRAIEEEKTISQIIIESLEEFLNKT